MKKSIRAIAAVLCVVMVTASLYGCTIKVDINCKINAQHVGNNSVISSTAAATQTSTATATQTSTDVPSTQAASATPDESKTEVSGGELSASSSKEEIVAEYAKVYNATKATGTFLGKDSMTCESIVIDGKENGTLKSFADKSISSNGTDLQLPPYSDDNPAMECLITAADVQEATYVDNGDGTATIRITPVETTNDKKFQGAQGKMFNVMEDAASTLADVPIISWAEGDANSNVTLITKDGYAEVTYNKDTKIMTKADYVLVTYADIVHCNINIGLIKIKDKASNSKFVYTMSFPQ